jgi:hypothetical protein
MKLSARRACVRMAARAGDCKTLTPVRHARWPRAASCVTSCPLGRDRVRRGRTFAPMSFASASSSTAPHRPIASATVATNWQVKGPGRRSIVSKYCAAGVSRPIDGEEILLLSRYRHSWRISPPGHGSMSGIARWTRLGVSSLPFEIDPS